MRSVGPAFANTFHGSRCVERRVHDFDAIHPVFDMITAQDDTGLVELAYRLSGIRGRRNHVVEGARSVLGIAESVAIFRVVGHLIFEADDVVLAVIRAALHGRFEGPVHDAFKTFGGMGGVERSQEEMLLNPVFHAAVARGRDAPESNINSKLR